MAPKNRNVSSATSVRSRASRTLEMANSTR